jgi:hypothetical protein
MDAVSLERVDFQHKSSLAAKLIELCQTVLVDVQKVPRNPDNKIDVDYIWKVKKAILNSIDTQLVKICKDELNLPVKVTVAACAGWNAGLGISFKAYSHGGDWIVPLKGREMFSGLAPQSSTFDVNYFKKFSENVNLQTSKLESYSTDYTIRLILEAGLFMGDAPVDKKYLTPLDAEEIAAILLHELGHAITILEHLGDVYHRADVTQNTMAYLSTAASEQTLQEVVSTVKKDPAEKDPDVEKATDDLSEKQQGLLNFAPVVALIVGFFMLGVIMEIIARMQKAASYGRINNSGEKTSDTVVTAANQAYIERIADEFVNRHGLGTAFATGLAKEAKYYEQGHQYDTFAEAATAIGFVQTTLLSYKIVLDLLKPFVGTMDSRYDPDWLRLEHILLNNMVVFKDEKLDDETRNYFIEQTRMLQDVITKYKARKNFKLRQFIWGTVFNVLSRTSILDGFNTANLSADYDKLQLWTNGLIKNKLMYHAARLKSLK